MHKFLVCSLLLIVGLTSCDSKRAYDRYETIPGSWNKDSVVSFHVKMKDTLSPYNLFINLRNDNNYSYSNLFLITEIDFPHGKKVTDTLQYEMTKPDGTWLGVGMGEIKENKLWYKQHVRFSEKGTYTVSIRQAMRQNGSEKGIEKLAGITEVGFRIEKIN